MIFYPSQNAADTNLCYNANCFTTLHYSFAEFTELPGGTIKENRRNFVVYAGRFAAVIFVHRVNSDEQKQSLKKVLAKI
jgi:hypothetical protein